MTAAYQISDKLARKTAVDTVTEEALAAIVAADEAVDAKEASDYFMT